MGRLEGSSNEGVLSFPKVIIPDRAERRRREASVTVFEQLSHIALLAEGRPGPSDDDESVSSAMCTL